jgi:hypothetical protein
MDRDRPDAHLARRTDNPQGDFTTVRDKDFIEHCQTLIR